MKRRQYSLIKWALFIPIYWVMMSIAASLALFQLIFKPHYWEKTKHGLHLHASSLFSGSTTVKEEPESVVPMQLPAFTSTKHVSPLLPASRMSSGSTTVTKDLEPMVTVPSVAFTSAGRLSERLPKRPAWQQWLKDPWLIATFVVACIASSAACWYFFQHHQILLQEDAISHLRIARRVLDNTPPGFGQLGGVWLPLPHVLMLPFVWNDYLWRTGLAGSFVGMFCYMVSVIYLFFSARRLTQDSRASFVGTLLFILNPDVLYVQATPLSEPVCIATMVITCYYFLAWTQDDHPKHLVGMAAGCFLATLARYDGWSLFLVLLVSIVVVGWIKRQRWEQIEGNLLVFGTLGALGIGLWMLWCWVILGDPLYFHHSTFAATNGSHFADTTFYTYHNMQESILAYMVLSIKTIGPILFVLAFIAIVVFVFRFRRTPSTIVGAVAFLTPFAFYFVSFYTGQVTIYLPGVGPNTDVHYIWNLRFGTEAVAPAALFLSILAMRWSITRLARLWGIVGSIVLVISICIQTILIAHAGILPLQDGQYGLSCVPTEPITVYLAQHHDGGKVLEDANTFYIAESEAGIDLKNTIYEGSTGLWKKALKDPASMVEWIIVSPDAPDDPIAKHIDLESPAFLSQFTLVVQEVDRIAYGHYHLSLYHRNGRSPLPARPIPSSLLTEHSLCR